MSSHRGKEDGTLDSQNQVDTDGTVYFFRCYLFSPLSLRMTTSTSQKCPERTSAGSSTTFPAQSTIRVSRVKPMTR